MAAYGYVRVSSTDQNEDRQVLAMSGLGIPQSVYLRTGKAARISSVRHIGRW